MEEYVLVRKQASLCKHHQLDEHDRRTHICIIYIYIYLCDYILWYGNPTPPQPQVKRGGIHISTYTYIYISILNIYISILYISARYKHVINWKNLESLNFPGAHWAKWMLNWWFVFQNMIIHTKVITPEPSNYCSLEEGSIHHHWRYTWLHHVVSTCMFDCSVKLYALCSKIILPTCTDLSLGYPNKNNFPNKNPAQMVNPFGFEYNFFTVQYWNYSEFETSMIPLAQSPVLC